MKYSFKFNCIWATYLFLFKQNKFVAMQKARTVLGHSPFFLDIIPLQIRLRFFVEASSVEEMESGLTSFEEQQRLQRYAVECMTLALGTQVKFWGTLISGDYDLRLLEQLSTQMTQYSVDAEKSFLRIIYLNPKNSLFRRLYSQFLLNVVNNETAAKRQLSRAVELEGEEEGGKGMTDSSNCIFIVSGESENRGEILEVNDKSCEVFECALEDIIGKSINTYMARPFAMVHNQYLLRYIENKPLNITDIQKRGLIMKNGSGVVFEADIQVREYANFTLEPSIAFFAVIKPQPLSMFCVIKRATLIVCDVSQMFFQFFNPDPAKLRNYELQISEHIPQLEAHQGEIDEALKHSVSHSMEVEINHGGIPVGLIVTVRALKYMENDFFLVHIERQDLVTKQRGGKSAEFKISEDENDLEPALRWNSADSSEDELTDAMSSEGGNSPAKGNDTRIQMEEGSIASSARSQNLIRMLLHRSNTTFDISMRFLLYAIIGLFVILCVFGVSTHIMWNTMSLSRFDSTLNILSTPIHVGCLTTTYSAQLYRHMMNGVLFTTPEAQAKEEDRIRRDLIHYRHQLDEFRGILLKELSALPKEEQNTIRKVRVTLVNHNLQETNMSFMEAVQQYTSTMSLLISRNLTDLRNDDLPLRFALVNQQTDLPQLWLAICRTILEHQDSLNKAVLQIEYGMTVAALSLVAFVTLAMFFPAVYNLNRRRAEVYELFERIEDGNMRDIYGQCVHRLRDLESMESNTGNMELQDLMEVVASKRTDVEARQYSLLRVRILDVIASRLSFGLLFILSVTLLYFLGYYIWWLGLYESIFQGIEFRVFHSVTSTYYIRRMMLGVINYDTDAQRFDMDTALLRTLEEMVYNSEHALYYGDSDFGIHTDIRLIDGGADWLNKDVCSLLATPTSEISELDLSVCPTVMKGVLSQNFHEATMAMISFMQDLRKTFLADPSDPSILDKILVIKELADRWLPASNLAMVQWMRKVFKSSFDYAGSFRDAGTASYVIVTILSLFLVYRPMVMRMNKDLCQTRNLLLLIPPEIVENSKTVRDTVKQFVDRMGLHE
jgi:PAS domain S-box-containing protein